MIVSASSSISCRTLTGGQPCPTTCSLRFSPAPSPRVKRPSLSRSTVAAFCATTAGWYRMSRAGHVRHQLDLLGHLGDGAQHAPGVRRVAHLVEPREVVVADHLEVEARRARHRPRGTTSSRGPDCSVISVYPILMTGPYPSGVDALRHGRGQVSVRAEPPSSSCDERTYPWVTQALPDAGSSRPVRRVPPEPGWQRSREVGRPRWPRRAAGARWAVRRPARRRRRSAGSSATCRRSPTNTPGLRQALLDLGAPGGMLDAQDDLFGPNGGPVLLITDPNLSLVNKNNPRDTAGMTFVGQFIDHDLTFDATSRLGVPTDPTRSPNGRTARFDLDSVYGGGPIAQSELYDPAHPIKLLAGVRWPVRGRAAPGRPLGGHRRPPQRLQPDRQRAARGVPASSTTTRSTRSRQPAPSRSTTFTEARRLTTWHYQWLVVNQVLPELRRPADGRRRAARTGRATSHAEPGPYIPVEFSGAAYRFGHSMVRPSYRANLAGDNGSPFFGLIFDSRVEVPDGQNPTSRPRRPARRLPRRRDGSSAGRRSSTSAAHYTRRRPAEQADRHHAVDAAVRPADQRDRAHPGTPGRSRCRSAPCCAT